MRNVHLALLRPNAYSAMISIWETDVFQTDSVPAWLQ